MHGFPHNAVRSLLAILVVLATAATSTAAAKEQPELCQYIVAHVDSNPDNFGFELLQFPEERNEPVPNANVTTAFISKPFGPREANHTFCYAIPTPRDHGSVLQLLSNTEQPWRDGFMAVATEGCKEVIKLSYSPEAMMFRKSEYQPTEMTLSFKNTVFPCPSAPITRLDVSDLYPNSKTPPLKVVQGATYMNSPKLPPPPVPKLGPGRGPDMIVVPETTARSLDGRFPYNNDCVYNDSMPGIDSPNSALCQLEESGMKFGCYRVLNFDVGIGNIGNEDLYIGSPTEQLHTGLFEYAPCHRHYHWKHFAVYELVDLSTGEVWQALKRGFCAIDWRRLPPSYDSMVKAESVRPERRYRTCGSRDKDGFQGVSPGWQDVYSSSVAGQYFCLDGCADQAPIPRNRLYHIRITANPPYTAKDGEPCPFKDGQNLCRRFFELNYDNNAAEVPIFIFGDEDVGYTDLPRVLQDGSGVDPSSVAAAGGA